MKVTIKMFAMLDRYLPAGASDNAAVLDVDEGTTAADLIGRFNMPPEMCHLVLLNGDYLQPEERAARALKGDDVLAIWPPIAGG